MRNSAIQSAHFQTVPLVQINLEDDTFRITTRTDVDDLATSIQNDGLITPPLLIKKTSTFTIVSGFRRICACRQLGWKEILACVLQSGVSPLDCLRFAITANSLQRPLNLIETSRSLQKLSSFLKTGKHLAESAATLGLPANPSIINKVKNLCLLPYPIQNSILTDTISLSMAIALGALEPDVAIAFIRLFNRLKISLNKQREIVTLVKEIAQRENTSVHDVLEDKTLNEILTNKDLDRSQKGRKIRSILRQRRFPTIYQAQQDFEFHRKKLKLGNDIKLIPPKEFEAATYTLNLTFANLTHLKMLQTRLDKIIQHPSFKKIVERKEGLSD